jgi:hypothetical protein
MEVTSSDHVEKSVVEREGEDSCALSKALRVNSDLLPRVYEGNITHI